MRHILLVALLLLCRSTFAQEFSPGYYIDTNGKQTTGLVRISDGKFSVSQFYFKENENAEPRKVEMSEVTELLAANKRYVRALVQYDQSSQDPRRLGVTSNPEWSNAHLVLQVLVNGTAKLYYYHTKEYSLYFYSVGGSPIEQLVFKNYLKPDEVTMMLSNRTYLAQLNTKVKCGSAPPVTDKNVSYTETSLKKYFRAYNTCQGDTEEIEVEPKQFRIHLNTGVNLISPRYVQGGRITGFEQKTTPRVGVDLEFTLPTRGERLSLMAEPNMVFYSTQITPTLEFKFNVFEFPVGIRYKFPLSEKTYIFVNAMCFADFPLVHKYQYSSTITDETSKGAFATAGGGGVRLARFSLEGRYYPTYIRKLGDSVDYRYEKVTFILGFRLN